MAFGARIGVCFSIFFLLTFLILCSATARSPIFFSNHEASIGVGRSLRVINLEDYGEPTANRGHDPGNGASWGGNAGRKG
ncbi:PSY1 protein [Spatholobus suberectus]|nr:PSY1 protein [Spatholobus suberectus]